MYPPNIVSTCLYCKTEAQTRKEISFCLALSGSYLGLLLGNK